MGIKQVFMCDHCNQLIDEAHPGVIVHGNIYVASPSDVNHRGGIVGNNFVYDDGKGVEYEKIKNMIGVDKVRESVYHTTCLITILNDADRPSKTTTRDAVSVLGRRA